MAYAITNRALRVIEIRDPLGIVSASGRASIGDSIFDLAPELIGSEASVERVLQGAAPRFQLDWLNRVSAADDEIYVVLVVLPLRNPSPLGNDVQIDGLILVVEDLTEIGILQQRLMQNRNELRLAQSELAVSNMELQAANAELLRLDELKSTFVSVAAHELRTPLAAILGYAEIMSDGAFGEVSDRYQDGLSIIEKSAQRLLTITNNLLDVTRIETGRMDLVMSLEDLTEVVVSVVAEYRPLIDERQQNLTVVFEPNLPPALCDRTRAMQIIGNLLSNASKYTPPGGDIEVSVRLHSAPGYLVVSVIDSGVGIAAADQDKLFTRFYRASTAYETGATGTGLGLNITRSLVELHGGSIWFESEQGVGSAFHATFSAESVAAISSNGAGSETR